MTLSILIVDDHPLVSAALVNVLADLRPRVNCSVAHTGLAAKQLLSQHGDFDLVLQDLSLPDVLGFDLLAHLRERYPHTPVLVVSASENPEDMRRAIAAGAMGYIGKSASPELLRKAAEAVYRGERYTPEFMASPPLAAAGVEAPTSEVLNARQLDVLRLMCAGESNKAIAYELGLAEKTVKGRVTAIFRALGVDSRMQAVLLATRLGLFTRSEAPAAVGAELSKSGDA